MGMKDLSSPLPVTNQHTFNLVIKG